MYIYIYIIYIYVYIYINKYIYIYIYILGFISIFQYILISIISICTSLLLWELIYCSRFCYFTAPIAMPNNDNTLICVTHTQLKYQKKIVKMLKFSNEIIKLILWI